VSNSWWWTFVQYHQPWDFQSNGGFPLDNRPLNAWNILVAWTGVGGVPTARWLRVRLSAFFPPHSYCSLSASVAPSSAKSRFPTTSQAPKSKFNSSHFHHRPHQLIVVCDHLILILHRICSPFLLSLSHTKSRARPIATARRQFGASDCLVPNGLPS